MAKLAERLSALEVTHGPKANIRYATIPCDRDYIGPLWLVEESINGRFTWQVWVAERPTDRPAIREAHHPTDFERTTT
jgi:hypothetical protein